MRIKTVFFALMTLTILISLTVAAGRPDAQRVGDPSQDGRLGIHGNATLAAVQPAGPGQFEFLTGNFSCGLNGLEVFLSAAFGGTIPISAGGVEARYSVAEDLCPKLFQGTADRLKEMGCTSGPVSFTMFGPGLPFACHGPRNEMVRVMTTVSDVVLLGTTSP